MNPIRLRRQVRWRSLSAFTSRPPMNTDPSSGVRRHPRSESSVVLPLPDGPMTRVSSPGTNRSVTSFRARVRAPFVPYQTLTPRTAKSRLGTEHLGGLDGQGRAHGEGRGDDADRQGKWENR